MITKEAEINTIKLIGQCLIDNAEDLIPIEWSDLADDDITIHIKRRNATIEPKLTQSDRKEGYWIATHERGLLSHPDSITYVCSECGYKIYTVYGMPKLTKYCQDCGARMYEQPE